MDMTHRGCAFRNAMKGGEHGKARRQGRGGDGRGIGDRRGDGQAFRRRGRERGILRSRRRARPARGGRARDRRAKVAFTQADVGTEAACLAFVNGAARKFGRLDILINNAGIRKYEKIDEASAASWNEILNVNLMSYVFCAKAAVPLMRLNKGAPSLTPPPYGPSSRAVATCNTTPPRRRSLA